MQSTREILWPLLTLIVVVAGLQSAQTAQRPARTGASNSNDPTLQTDKDWIDDRWTKTDVGRFLSATIPTPGGATYKGIAIKVGDQNEATVCFDTELLRYSAGWTGGFVTLNARRFGLLDAPQPKGEFQFSSATVPAWAQNGNFKDPRPAHLGPLPRNWARYRGLHLHGPRVALAYTVGPVSVLDSPWLEKTEGLQVFTRSLELGPTEESLLLRACDLPGQATITNIDGVRMAIGTAKGAVTAVALAGVPLAPSLSAKGGAGAGEFGGELRVADGSAQVFISARMVPSALKILIWHGSETELPKFAAAAKASPEPAPLQPLTSAGPAHWTELLVTRGQVDPRKGPFVIDTLALPYKNPWNALLFTSGHDFFENGDVAVCTVHGDVWRVSGVDARLENLTWKRFATGLYQPLGLRIINNRVHVLGRDQITILHDLDNDGEADFYENFNNDVLAAGGGHSYATGLETDPDGNFYFLKCGENTPHGGTVLRVSKDGHALDVVATGFRNPNGMGISPSGLITVADQQGEWVPETRLDIIHRGGFYGYMPMHHRAQAPAMYDPPLCWIPRAVDNSAGGEAWLPKDAWGALGGRMLHLSYGRCTFMAVLQDDRNPAQGGVVPLPGKFLSGAMRARFNARDGCVYVSGLRGWQTAAARDGCLQRIRYTGQPLYLPVAYAVRTNGVRLTFSQALEQRFAEDAGSYAVEQWNYRWTARYGSPEFSVAHPNKEGRDEVPVKAAHLLEDDHSVFIEMPPLVPVMAMRIQYSLGATDGKQMRGEFYLTINEVKGG